MRRISWLVIKPSPKLNLSGQSTRSTNALLKSYGIFVAKYIIYRPFLYIICLGKAQKVAYVFLWKRFIYILIICIVIMKVNW